MHCVQGLLHSNTTEAFMLGWTKHMCNLNPLSARHYVKGMPADLAALAQTGTPAQMQSSAELFSYLIPITHQLVKHMMPKVKRAHTEHLKVSA